jgi:hypothetical protein
MSQPPKEISLSPRCESCGHPTSRLGKLPRIGLRPLVYVYKCEPCHQIMSIEPDQRESLVSLSPR